MGSSLTYTDNDKHSGKAECNHNHGNPWYVEVNDIEEDKVKVVIPPIKDKTEQANRTLREDEDKNLQNKQFVQTGENILLDCGN